jgi:DNA-binding NtrC family response regulator
MQRLQAYSWPGNIRELQNVLERACVMATSPIVEIDDDLRAIPMDRQKTGALVSLDENERAHIRRALAATGGKIHGPRGAASILDINPSTLRSRMEKLGIEAA